ncbi:MAG: hypothetical protein HY017_22850 [Betaproteobacteria bacterium]|nr:hypothetical protein [Betaproteobacteria bacterium]
MRYVLAGLIVSSALVLGGCAAIVPATQAGAAAIAAHGGAATVAVGAGAGAVAGLAAPEIYKALKRDQETAQEPATPGSFDAFLAASQSEVRILVQRAMQARREVLVVAGVRARSAIAHGRAAFRDSLSRSVSALGEQEKSFKGELETLVSKLYSPADIDVKDAGERAQAIAYRLRSSGAVPLLNSNGPIFLFPSIPSQSINVSGNFPASYTGEAVPQLTIGGKSYKAFDHGPDRLSFAVPTLELNAAEPAEILWKTGVISVPWTPPSRFFSAQEIEQLGIEIAVLPHSFGRMSMDHTITTTRTEEKTRVSREVSPDTANTEAPNRQCLVLAPQELAEGWRIRPGTSAFVPGAGRAGLQNMDIWKLGLLSETEQAVCWRASAADMADAPAIQSAYAGGRAEWRISATIWREVKESGITRKNVDLAWGSRHYFRYPAGTWKLRYSKTGSAATELAAADESHPLIRVSTDSSGVTVRIYPF